MSSSERQKAHYESIHDDYDRHYFDDASMQFREQFIYDVLLKGVDLKNKRMADLCSSSGNNSKAVKAREPSLDITGFDISAKAVEAYRELNDADAYELDLTKGEIPDVEPFDIAMVIGGLHHCVVDLEGTFKTLAKIVKPGGTLLMYEPNAKYVLEGARAFWYKFDRYFDAETEAALDHDRIAKMAQDDFVPQSVKYMGGPAYFLIYNSLITRMPQQTKDVLKAPIFGAERAYNKLPGKRAYPYFIANWKRR